MTAELLRGTLPPFRLGDRALRRRGRGVPAALARHGRAARRHAAGRSTSTSTSATAAGSPAPSPGVYGTRLLTLGYSRLKAKQRLDTWIELLALTRRPTPTRAGPATPSAASGPARKRALTGPLDHRARRLAARPRRAARPRPDQAAAAADRHGGGLGRGARAGRARGRRRRAPGRPPGVGDRPVQRLRSFARGRRTPTTCGSTAPAATLERAARRRPADVRLAGLGAAAHRCREGRSAVTDPQSLLDHRPAADRHHAARGERRHRQDLDHRRAGHPLRRRGRRAARADAGRHLRPGGQPGAARAGPRPARRGRAACSATTPPSGRRPWATIRRPWCRCCWPTTTSSAAWPTGGSSTRWSGSTRRPSRPPTSSARWCSTPSASPATPTPAPGWSRTSTTWSRRPSTTSTSARSRSTSTSRPSTTPTALAIARKVVDDPQARLEPADEDRATAAGRRVAFAPRRARRDRAPQATARHPLLRRPAQPARRRAPGARVARRRPDAPPLADRAGRRVPGHRPGAVGGARPGVQRTRHDGADRRPQAGHLRLPRRRRRRRTSRPPTTAATRQTLAVNWRSDQPLLVVVAGAAARRRARRRADRGPRRRGAPPREPAGRGAGAAVPGAGRACAQDLCRSGPACSPSARCGPTSPTTSPTTYARLLDSGATFEGRPLRPRDVAVISYRHADLADAQAALAAGRRARR